MNKGYYACTDPAGGGGGGGGRKTQVIYGFQYFLKLFLFHWNYFDISSHSIRTDSNDTFSYRFC